MALCCCLALAGCTVTKDPAVVEAVEAAKARYEQIEDDPGIQEAAPEELAMAKLYLDKSQQVFRRGWINRDIKQFAVLSETYSKLAQEKGTLVLVQQRTAQLEQTRELLNNLGLVITDRGLLLLLDNQSFLAEEAGLQPDLEQTFDFLAEFLVNSPERKVLIESFTDNVAPADQSRRFTEARGQTVRDELVRRGVAANRIRVDGLGEAYPVASNANPLGRLQNRRVELRVGSYNGAFPAPITATDPKP